MYKILQLKHACGTACTRLVHRPPCPSATGCGNATHLPLPLLSVLLIDKPRALNHEYSSKAKVGCCWVLSWYRHATAVSCHENGWQAGLASSAEPTLYHMLIKLWIKTVELQLNKIGCMNML